MLQTIIISMKEVNILIWVVKATNVIIVCNNVKHKNVCAIQQIGYAHQNAIQVFMWQ